MTQIQVGIAGIQETQKAVMDAAALMVSPEGLPGTVGKITLALHRYAVAVTHVGRYRQTKSGKYRYAKVGEGGVGGGSLRASHLVSLPSDMTNPVGVVYVNPSSVNPLTGGKPSLYGLYEQNRGGEHAFYARAIAEADAAGVIPAELQVLVEKIDGK